MRAKAQAEGRPLPHDRDAEIAVLGAIIRDPGNYRKASRFVSAGDFFFGEHRIAFEGLSRLASEGKATDDASLIAYLSDVELIERAGGQAYVAQHADGVHGKFDVTVPARRVHRLSLLRRIANRLNLMVDAALQPRANPGDILNSAVASLRALTPHVGANGFAQPGSGADILEDVEGFIRRFVFLTADQTAIVTLWTAHTHAFACAYATPYLSITSAEKQSGKTRLLEVLELLTANPWLTGRTSAAALVRKIDGEVPTLLLDESDAAFAGDREYAEALRGILNAGHRIGGKASLCVGQGKDIAVRDYNTFCPKAIAGLAKLPDTVADRSIPVVLKRAAKGEIPERFRRTNVKAEAIELRDRLAQWTASIFETLDKAVSVLPESLTDRQQDGAEPLLAIADAAGGDWPFKARSALVSVLGGSDHAESIGTRLLADIRGIFNESKPDKITSQDLVSALVTIESAPWSEWAYGKGLNPSRLARLLKPFGIEPHNIKVKAADGRGHVPKGYERSDFEDAWARYLSLLPSGNATPLAATKNAGILQVSPATEQHAVAASSEEKPAKNGPGSGVAFFDRPGEGDCQLEGLGIS